MPRPTIEEWFDELAAAELPAPTQVSVVARGRQRRLRGRVAMAASVLALVAVTGSALAYVQSNVGPNRHHNPGPTTTKRIAPLPGTGPLLLGIEEAQGWTRPSWKFVMTRVGDATRPVPLGGLPPGAANEAELATNPANGWVISYATGQKNFGDEPQRLATVSTSGAIRSFGPAFTERVVITALAVRPDSSAVAVAITHVKTSDSASAPPAQIELIPLPGHSGGIRTWTLAPASPVRTLIENMSWSPDGTQLTYMPGDDQTGGGFASQGAVSFTISARSSLAPSVSNWPPFEKGRGQCVLQAGAWQNRTNEYLALEQCSSDLAVVAANPVTGTDRGPAAQMRDMSTYLGCGRPMLDPAPDTTEVLISGCGLLLYKDNHFTAVSSPLAGATAWAGLGRLR